MRGGTNQAGDGPRAGTGRIETGIRQRNEPRWHGGKSVQLAEFGIFSPTIRAKSADEEKDVSSKSIVQRKIIFYPGKIFKDTLEDMSITRRVGSCRIMDTEMRWCGDIYWFHVYS